MDVKFNAETAMSLIKEMDRYCRDISRDTSELINVLNFSGEWNDDQMKQFYESIMGIGNDLNKALSLQSEYMNVFLERVNELRG